MWALTVTKESRWDQAGTDSHCCEEPAFFLALLHPGLRCPQAGVSPGAGLCGDLKRIPESGSNPDQDL